jgi:antitoxin VapB
MAISIKNSHTEKLARQVAEVTGESITEAIQKSLQERIERLQKQRRQKQVEARLEEIVLRLRALPVLDKRSADEIIGYDEHGIPL